MNAPTLTHPRSLTHSPSSFRPRSDYRPMANLDKYEADGLDEEPEDYDAEAELEARLRAEAALDDRDDAERGGERGAGRVRPRALDADDDDDDQWRRQQRRRRAADRDEGEEDEARDCGHPGRARGRKKAIDKRFFSEEMWELRIWTPLDDAGVSSASRVRHPVSRNDAPLPWNRTSLRE